METQAMNKTVVVSGATSGIGLAAAEILVRQGVSVIGIGRSTDRCGTTESRLRSLNPSVAVRYIVADLSLQSGVRAAAGKVREALAAAGRSRLDGLLNNAGGFSFWLEYTAEGVERQWALNYLAPFLLTHELLPLLQAAPMGRVVTVSSGSHYGARMHWDDLQLRRHYSGLTAYGQSKLADVLFTRELNRRLGPQSTVHAFAADPGLVKTNIGMKGTPAYVAWFWKIWVSHGIEPAESAKGITYLLTEPSIQNASDVYWKHGLPVTPDKRALDNGDARRLWEISEKMCGMGNEASDPTPFSEKGD